MNSTVLVKGLATCAVVAAAMGFYMTVPVASAQSAATGASQPLDYEFFKTRVEPIFLKQRSPDHARCYACHEKNHHDNKNFRLETLEPGSTFWTEAQSRRNFQVVSTLIFAANPSKSLLLIKALDPRAGGYITKIHSGGSQFASKQDPDWLIMEAWANGKKASDSTAP